MIHSSQMDGVYYTLLLYMSQGVTETLWIGCGIGVTAP